MGLKEVVPAPYEGEIAKNNGKRLTKRQVSGFEVFNACVNDLTGKDKLAKTIQYGIRTIAAIHEVNGLGNPSVAKHLGMDINGNIVRPVLNGQKLIEVVESVDSNDNNETKFSSISTIITLFSKILTKYAKIMSQKSIHRGFVIMVAYITNKLSSLLQGLNIYRHLLRAGTIPFRIWKFSNHIKWSLKILLDRTSIDGPAVKMETVIKYWTSKDLISQMINFWYAISDEILLLYRFKFLLNGNSNGKDSFSNSLFQFAEDHELYSWMGSILLGLNNDWNKWILLKDKESRIILNKKVKARTRRIVSDIKKNNSNEITTTTKRNESPDFDKYDNEDTEIAGEEEMYYDEMYYDELSEVKRDKTTVKINAIRLTCDMIFDAKYIFHWNMYKPLHVVLGLTSGSLGLYNVWRQKRYELENKQ
ncbi:Pex25 protein [Pichia kluyveri]|uniref:Pex25 protein n=1 Tax=Pichia kluyveri TaxID=36015 RepID=A0AAV5R1U7_PICKL|nr:Pex25 protein [Pichia kluyveri]